MRSTPQRGNISKASGASHSKKEKESIEIVQGIKYHPCRSIVYGPSKASPTNIAPANVSLALEHVYGYSNKPADGSGISKNIMKSLSASGQGHLLFSAGVTIAIMKPPSLKQKFFREHTSAITSICMHPTGLFVASAQASRKGIILVWNISSIISAKAKKFATVKLQMHEVQDMSNKRGRQASISSNHDYKHSLSVIALDFSSDGRFLLAVDSNHNIVIFDWALSSVISRTRTGQTSLSCIRFNHISSNLSSSSKAFYTLTSVGDDVVKFWTLTSSSSDAKPVQKYHSPKRSSIDSAHLHPKEEDSFELIGATGSIPKNPDLDGAKFTNIEFIPRSTSASSPSQLLSIVATSTSTGAVFLWEQLSHPSSDKSLVIWSTKSRLLSVVLDMHASLITRILYINLPSNNTTDNTEVLISCCKDGEILLWNINRSPEHQSLSLSQAQIPLISLPSVDEASAGDKKAFVTDIAWDESLQAVFVGSSRGAVYKLDTASVVSSSTDSISHLQCMVEGHQKSTVAVATSSSSSSSAYPCIFATASVEEGVVRLWNASTFQSIVTISIDDWTPTAVVIVPRDDNAIDSSSVDALNLIVGNSEGEIAFVAVDMSSSPVSYNVMATKKLQSKSSSKTLTTLPTINPNSQMTSGVESRTKNAVKIMRFSPDHSIVAVVCENEKLVYILSTSNQYRRLMICRGHHHTSTIIAIDISRDGKFLQANDANHEVLHWEIESGKLLMDGSAVRDVYWDTWTCPYGWPVQGLVLQAVGDSHQPQKQRQISHDHQLSAQAVIGVALSSSESCLLASYDSSPGAIKLFRYPCLAQSSPSSYHAHGDVITGFGVISQDSDGDNPTRRVLSVSKDGCLLQWKLERSN
jgi:WD40 repeat protein